MYTSVNELITSLSYIAHNFKISKASPLISFWEMSQFVFFVNGELKPEVLRIEREVEEMIMPINSLRK